MIIRPTTLRAANDFVAEHHRHNGRTARNGGKFAISLWDENSLIGTAIVGNPLSATYMNREKYGWVAEVLRSCVLKDAKKGSVSCLYGACWRAWKAMGGTRLITYTLQSESGSSLRGAGWVCEAKLKPTERNWRKADHLSETRVYDARCMGVPKYRWSVGVQKQDA